MYLQVKWFADVFSSKIRELGSAENDTGFPEGSKPHKETRRHGADVNHPVAHGEISIARQLDLNCAENRSDAGTSQEPLGRPFFETGLGSVKKGWFDETP